MPPALPTPLAEAVLEDGRPVVLRQASDADVSAMLSVIHAAFAARPALGARPAALAETVDTLRDRLTRGPGYLAEVDGVPAATIMTSRAGHSVRLGRVAVHPDFQRHGVATFALGVLLSLLAEQGEESASLLCRKEFPEIEAWWGRHGFARVGDERDCWVLGRTLPVVAEAADADAMRDLGRRLAGLLRAGDVIIASGDLGAGKTTFTQGLGAGLDVDGPVISPTFVLSRVHEPHGDGPKLVHVDAYRLGDSAELDDLDLDATLDDAVTLIEWGTGVAEYLADDRLDIDIRRGLDPDDETRWVFITPIGERWDRDEIARAVGEGFDSLTLAQPAGDGALAQPAGDGALAQPAPPASTDERNDA